MPLLLRAKCVVVGDATVGKSAITQAFHSDGTQFPKAYTMNVGVELCTKLVTIPETHDHLELFIYDSAGKEIFSDIVTKHWEHPSMIMVVFDVTSETSFSSCAKWLERVKGVKGHKEMQIPAVLVGNKTDLDQRRIVTIKDAQDFAKKNKLTYFEVSAKDGLNIEQPFLHLAKEYQALYAEKIEHFKSLV